MRRRSCPRGPLALILLAISVGRPAIVRADETSPKPQESKRARTDHSTSPQASNAPALRDETFRLMDAYLISNLQESLDLTDPQFAQALPLVKRLQSDRRAFATKRMQALRMLRRTLNSGRATEASVSQLLADLKKAVADERTATVSNLEALDAVLTPLQQAKYRVFEAEVDVRLRRLRERSQNRERPDSR